MFRPPDSAVGPARRPISGLYFTAIGAVVLVLLAGFVAWLAKPSTPKRQAGARIEITLPPVSRRSTAVASAPRLPADKDFERLIAGGDPTLIERGPSGPLPIVAEDGRRAWQVYAAPFDAADRHPRIAVIIAGLGRAGLDTQSAIDKLPPSVTLAFDPYAPDLPDWIAKARAAHHEVLMSIPMEPLDYPREDPGPQTLLTALPVQQNLDRLEWALSRAVGYVGITNMMGSRFTAAAPELRPVLEVVNGRGLLFVETRATNPGAVATLAGEFALPYAVTDRDLDADLSRTAVDQALLDSEPIARRKNRAIVAGSLYPLTVERVVAWSKTLPDKDLVLAPISAMVTIPPVAKPAEATAPDAKQSETAPEAKPEPKPAAAQDGAAK
ncbi:MAG: divergent polysaccharide deacetylase family protein [Rhodospirillales bacterium]|nr:divergent polysaccharide deacetylase family protein [Rhodospirillales bacterium]